MTVPAIEVDGLTKRFGPLVAVDRIRFDVPEGCVYGFLGPNGSGKTTTIGMLAGLIPPDDGTARIHGTDVRADLSGALQAMGALVEEPAFYPHLTGRQNLQVLARIAGAEASAVERALATVHLVERADDKFKGYSQGMRRRLGLAAALLNDPRVVVLDEPTNGLDPSGQQDVRALLKRLAQEGRTVLVSSHLLHDVQEMCSHVAIVHKGRLIAAGPIGDILAGGETLVIDVDDPHKAARLLDGVEGVGAVTVDGGRLRVEASGERAADVNRALVSGGIAVSGLARHAPALEERFLALTREAGGDP